MALTIDQLEIQIISGSQNAQKGLDRLISTLGRFSNATNKANGGMSKFFTNLKTGSGGFDKFTSRLTMQITKWRTLIGVFRRVATVMGNWLKESNKYIETLNLFNVTMGDGAEAAMAYAEKVQSLMGIDIAEWMNYQGTFKQLTNGFGVAEEAANTMSQNLTQLSYDLASFFNTDVETAFEKLSSAMSGQVKGLRQFGIDTTVASLQEYALAQGIDKSVRSMTQAEKSMLRYNYIMEHSIKMQGDMARTIITPANALRILNAQLTQMKRAFGNVISVLVTQIIPYVQVFVQMVTEAAQKLAVLFGFTIPEIDYSSFKNMSGGLEEAEENADAASGAVKKLKKQLMGFDELNIISSPNAGGAGDSDSDLGGGGLNMELRDYDFLKDLDTSRLDGVREKLEKILDIAKAVGIVLAAWKISKLITGLLTAIPMLKGISALGLTIGLTLAIAGIAFEWKGIISSIKEGLNKINFSEILAGAGLTVGGGALSGAAIGKAFGVALTGSVLGAAIGGIVAGIPMLFVGIYDAIKNGLNWLSGVLIPLGATLSGAGIGAIIGMVGGPIGAGVGALIGLAVGAITDLTILIVQNWETISAWCIKALSDIGQFFVGLWEDIKSVWNSVAEWFNTTVVTPVVDFFTGLWNGITSNVSACVEGVKTAWNTFTGWIDAYIVQPVVNLFTGLWNGIVTIFAPAIAWFSQLFDSIRQTVDDVFYNIGVIAKGCWEIIKVVWGKVSAWFDETVIQPVKEFFEKLWFDIKTTWNNVAIWFDVKVVQPIRDFFMKLWLDIKETAISAWNGIKSTFSTIRGWISEKIIQPVGKFFTNLWDGFKEGAKKAWEGVKSVFSTVATFFRETFEKAWRGIIKVFSVAGEIFTNIKNGIVSAFKFIVNSLISGLNKVISIPFNGINTALEKIKSISIFGLTPFVDLKYINVPQIPLLAEGGMVDTGQMFIAREAGPELVGRIGNKTTVANNDQIIAGIESGVYRAMVAANGNGGGAQTIRIINEIDGDVVGERVIKYHNGIVMQTGESPLLA